MPRRPVRGLRSTALAASVVVLLGAVACSSAPAPTTDLVIATGNGGGVYDVYGRAIAERLGALGRPAVAQGSDGSVENVRRVVDDEADLGFSLADVAALAVTGSTPFDRAAALCAVARLYDNYVQAVALADSPVQDSSDLAGRVVAIGSAGSGTAVVAGRVLSTLGLEPGVDVEVVNLDVGPAAQALATGEIDAMFWSGGLPTEPISRLAQEREITFLDLDDVAADLASRYGDVYRPSVIRASVYEVDAPVQTVSVANYLVTRCDVAADDIRMVLDILFDPGGGVRQAHPEAERLNSRSAIATGAVPLHPAAVSWFREHDV